MMGGGVGGGLSLIIVPWNFQRALEISGFQGSFQISLGFDGWGCWSLCDYLVSGPVRVRALEQSTVTGTVRRVYLVPGPGRVRALAMHSNRHCLPCIVLVVGGCRPRGRHG
jgi:hypothetical protein